MGVVSETENLLRELETHRGTPLLREHAPSMRQIAKVSYTHDALIDEIVNRPTASQGELAAVFGFSPSWICQIIASDAFQVRLAERKDALVDPGLRATIKERFDALVRRSLDVLQHKLAKHADDIPDNLALRAAELGARSLGLGRADPVPPAPAGDRLVILSERLVGLLADRKQETINGTSTRVEDTGGPEALRGPESREG